jgi:hypothetical protein
MAQRERGDSLSEIGAALACSKSSLSRHFRHVSQEPNYGGRSQAGTSQTAPFQRERKRNKGDEDRCPRCQVSVTEPKPDAMLKRAERLIFQSELIIGKGLSDENFSLVLRAIDRATSALTLTMKALHMLGPDTVSDNRGVVNIFAGERTEDLRMILAALRGLPTALVGSSDLESPTLHPATDLRGKSAALPAASAPKVVETAASVTLREPTDDVSDDLEPQTPPRSRNLLPPSRRTAEAILADMRR